jgi:hypothetical protein
MSQNHNNRLLSLLLTFMAHIQEHLKFLPFKQKNRKEMHRCLMLPEILEQIFEKLFRKEEEYGRFGLSENRTSFGGTGPRNRYTEDERQAKTTLASLAITCRTFMGNS